MENLWGTSLAWVLARDIVVVSLGRLDGNPETQTLREGSWEAPRDGAVWTKMAVSPSSQRDGGSDKLYDLSHRGGVTLKKVSIGPANLRERHQKQFPNAGLFLYFGHRLSNQLLLATLCPHRAMAPSFASTFAEATVDKKAPEGRQFPSLWRGLTLNGQLSRAMAQLASALAWGARGRGFKSR